MEMIDASTLDLQEKVVAINRVSKTVKGGRVMKFSALVVVGDGNGTVGFGLGKAAEVPEAIRKGLEDAKKNLHKIAMKGTTIPHEVVGKFGAGQVLMRPAPEGTGVIAGGAVRAVLEVAGIKDIRTKCQRTNNPCNVVTATMNGLPSLMSAEQVRRKLPQNPPRKRNLRLRKRRQQKRVPRKRPLQRRRPPRPLPKRKRRRPPRRPRSAPRRHPPKRKLLKALPSCW